MPRKQRTPKTRHDVPMTPALQHFCMTGEYAAERIPGWVEEAQRDSQAPLGAAWLAHGDTLSLEAATHGFEAFAATGRRPSGPGVERWRTAFVERFRY